MTVKIAIDVTERAGGWHWFSRDEGGALVLWNAEPFPSRPAAERDALAFHNRPFGQMTQAYEGAY